jgi:hypothetical protein
MSVVYSLTTKNARMQLVANLIQTMVLGTSALSGATGVLATINLGATTVSGGVLTLTSVPITTTGTAAGTASKAELRDGTGTTIASGLAVATTGTEVIIANPNITLGESLTVNSGTLTHG